FGVQVVVARVASESVVISNSRYANDVYLKIKIAHHLANNRELLKIFFAKDSHIRRKNVEQFRHNRADAPKMTGSRLATECFRKRSLFNKNRAIVGIHFHGRWPE